MIELIEYWSTNPPSHIMEQAIAGYKARRKKVKGRVQNEKEFRDAGLLPTDRNTASELALPEWVREVRQMDRANRMAEQIKAKPNGQR